MSQLVRIFSTPIFKTSFDKTLCDSALQSVFKLKDKKEGYQQQNNWCSRDDLHQLDPFNELSTEILKFSKGVLDHITLIRDSEYITCMWANVNKVGHQHPQHIHGNAFLSGVLYLQLPEGSGKTYFVDPRPAAKVFSFDFKDNPNEWMGGSNWGPPPAVGDLIVFPSWLPHGVDFATSESDAERVSLSFNIMPKLTVDTVTRRISL